MHGEIIVHFYNLLVCVLITQTYEAQMSQKRIKDLSQIDFYVQSYLKHIKLPS